LVLVLSQHYKQVINLLLTMRRLIGFALYLNDGSFWAPAKSFRVFAKDEPNLLFLDTYNLPSQI